MEKYLSEINYDQLVEKALKHVVIEALKIVERQGLPGDHHFYVAFRTDHPGVKMDDLLRSQYPKEMIRAFFDYWSELNKSETKMRYELEKTWELPRRLATWASREKVPSKTDVGIVLKDNSPGKYKKGW